TYPCTVALRVSLSCSFRNRYTIESFHRDCGLACVAERGDRRSMFLSGRSLQQSDANQTSVEVCVSVSSTLKHQRCRNLCFGKFASLHPICKIKVPPRP